MSTLTFDTLKYTERLRAAGVSEPQAKVEAEALRDVLAEALDSTLATKADIARLESSTKADIARLESSTKADIARLEASIEKNGTAPDHQARRVHRHGRRHPHCGDQVALIGRYPRAFMIRDHASLPASSLQTLARTGCPPRQCSASGIRCSSQAYPPPRSPMRSSAHRSPLL